MHLMRSCPTGPTKTRQEYDIYKLKTPHATPEAHQRMLEFYQKVIQEDLDLCNAAQKNLSREIYSSGPLHPFYEEGVISFQKMVMERLRVHLDEEKAAGEQIWPAKPQSETANNIKKEYSQELGCESMVCKDTRLAW